MSATMLTDVQADVFPDKAELDAAEERLSEAVTPFEILSRPSAAARRKTCRCRR
jgi:hypothetical protein